MNDGIGRISPNVMRKIRDELGLTDTPCAIQARLGSAKGMWITDVTDASQEDWIETYESQRKWECDWSDEYHRTLEVKSCVAPLRPANLNLQFLPILEDGAIDKLRMRNTIGEHLAVELGKDLDSMKTAIKHPELFRQWAREASTRSSEPRITSREVPFLGGLPNDEQDKMTFLADGGFDPMQQKYLQDIVFLHQRKKCQKLEKDLKIRIARSTYAFMVVDFWGVLAPGEVHICFSSKFGDGPDEYLDLDGIDVLVARSPAHLPSDIQKVRAVFKPELRRLKDVIIFPRTGMEPLADKLSGGDYDGDKAWVCWEPEIVDNFRGKPPPVKPEFSLERDADKVKIFLSEGGGGIDAMLEKAFAFNLQPKLLGMCTSYKERLSYYYNSISHKSVIALSWLLSELADQAKSGIVFNDQHWRHLRNRLVGEKRQLPNPAYKSKMTARWAEADHIIDHLRFVVAKGVIDHELASLTDFYKMDPAHSYDTDVVNYWNQFEMALGQPDRNGIPRASWFVNLKRNLRDDLMACSEQWRDRVHPRNDFRSSVLGVYDRWRKIEPRISSSAISAGDGGNDDGGNEHRSLGVSDDTAARAFLRQQNQTHHPDLSHWQLLKASMTFRMFHDILPNFTWQVAGRQLQFIKAMKAGSGAVVTSAPIPVVPRLYAALRPDNKYIKQVMAREAGRNGGGGEYYDDADDDDYNDVFEDAEEDFVAYPDLDRELAGLGAAVGGLVVR
ncbi:hypothetical protein SLS62_008858 [Diatrype stigma]|uniref:RNA-dependent RNA polymerase n=1 Tax=Diatrype stigma TaxID=117547 RepID=A0AAN9UJ53_9PEZI